MSTSDTPVPGAPAPGWYPDPTGVGGLRWWDGVHWTDHVSTAASPYTPARRRPLPEGTPVYTVWIWLVVALPIIPVLLLFLVQPQVMFHEVSVGGRSTLAVDPFALIGGPVYFLVAGLGWLVTAAVIVFSWLDYRELVRRGVERPFHWAWSFLGIVYPIGRSVIVRGVAGGRGLAPLWAAIAVQVVAFAVAMVWTIVLVSQILGTVSHQVPYGA
ncbi:DUF2510 domain-containing protein [Leifsonia sp. NPDC077715]|uniref:DUF2510 domain-containing protein n=1 Tax=Leifsonia sp. NPDC077715 TaxID=3155539 RepID=UPI0034389AB8